MNTLTPPVQRIGRIRSMVPSSTLASEFLQHMHGERQCSDYTISSYRADLCQFEGFVRRNIAPCENSSLSAGPDIEQLLKQVNAASVRAFMAQLEKQNYKPASIARKVAVLKSFYRFLTRQAFIPINPLASVKVPRPAYASPVYLEPAQLAAVLQAPGAATHLAARDSAILHVIAFSGLSVSEALRLTIADIDFDGGTIRVSGKASRSRSVPLPDAAVIPLRRYLHLLGDAQVPGDPLHSDRLFLNCHGMPLSSRSVRRNLASYVVAAGLPVGIRPATLRHSFARRLLDEGTHPRRVQELLGRLTSNNVSAFASLMTVKKTEAVAAPAHVHGVTRAAA